MKATLTHTADDASPGFKINIKQTKISEKNTNLLFDLLQKARGLKSLALVDTGLYLKPITPQEDTMPG